MLGEPLLPGGLGLDFGQVCPQLVDAAVQIGGVDFVGGVPGWQLGQLAGQGGGDPGLVAGCRFVVAEWFGIGDAVLVAVGGDRFDQRRRGSRW